MKQVPDYYAVLGVDANAPPETLKKAFKHLALQYHPDIYKGEDAEERMREILLAYQTLIDPERRRSFDRSRPDHIPGSSMAQAKNTEVAPTARRDRQRYYGFPALNEDAPAHIDLGEITYLLSPGEVRRLKVQGICARREGSVHGRDILLPSLPASMASLYWLLGSSVRERGPWAFTARLFFVVR